MELLIMLCSFLYSYGPNIQAATKGCGKLSHGSVTFTLLRDASSPGGSTLPPQGDKKKISAAQSPREGDAGAAAPHTIPARLSGRP